MIVADTNVISAVFISGPETQVALRLLQLDPDWSAPLLWRSEMHNVLSKYMRNDGMPIEKAMVIMQESKTLLASREFDSSSEDVLRLVSTSTCSAYDCEFVALAQQLAVPLVTIDSRILRNFPSVAMPPKEFVHR